MTPRKTNHEHLQDLAIAEIKQELKTLKALLADKLDSNMEVILAIKEQTTKTNGRVTQLEVWQTLLKGGWMAIVGVIIVLGWLYINLLK